MSDTGDQSDTVSITKEMDFLDIGSNEIREVMETMKNTCESMVNNDSNNNTDQSLDDIREDYLLRRGHDSEAEETDDGQLESRSDGQTGYATDDTIKDKSSSEQKIRVSVISTEPNKDPTNGLTLHGKPNRALKPRTEKWGESVGIVYEDGRVKRVISLDELHNYLILESWAAPTDSKLYCSLINERYPRFFDSTIDYLQRWRMRYNIFVDKVLVDKSDESLVHIGELHMYFDLIPKFPNPFYVNNSFYSNPNDAEKEVNLEKLQKMRGVFESIRKSQSIFQLKFPIRSYLFHNTDHIFDKFKERHHEIMEESRAVHRKGVLRKQRQKNNEPPIRGGMSRSDRDFGQSSRDFHQTGRQFPRDDRKFNDMDQRFAGNGRQELPFNERGFDRNKRGFGRRNGRTFSANSRKPFNPRPKNMTDRRRRRDTENSIEAEPMFEDTSERHERNVMKPIYAKPHKGGNRSDRVNEQRMDAFRDSREPLMASKERNQRNNNRSIDSDSRRHNSFRGKDNHYSSSYTPATGVMFSSTDIETNGRSISGHTYAQPTGYYRYN